MFDNIDEFIIKFNNCFIFLLSAMIAIIGCITFPRYNIFTIQFLICIVLTLISMHFCLLYARK
jgi:hypothetical protein